MESNSKPGKINNSGTTYELIKDEFECPNRGKINAKNKGEVDVFCRLIEVITISILRAKREKFDKGIHPITIHLHKKHIDERYNLVRLNFVFMIFFEYF
jgi:hypothetical protein